MKTRQKVKPFHFFTELEGYPFHVLVSVGETREKVEALLSRFGCGKKHPDCMEGWEGDLGEFEEGHAVLLKCNRSVLWFCDADLTFDRHGTIAHESSHLIFFAFERMGLRLTSASDEAYAYAIGTLVANVIAGLKGYRKSRALRHR